MKITAKTDKYAQEYSAAHYHRRLRPVSLRRLISIADILLYLTLYLSRILQHR